MPRLHSTSGGSSDTEANELAVIPCGVVPPTVTTVTPVANVPVDSEKVARCRALAADIAGDVQSTIDAHTTVGVERTVARAYGVEGADPEGTPLANTLVERIHARGFTGHEMLDNVDLVHMNGRVGACPGL